MTFTRRKACLLVTYGLTVALGTRWAYSAIQHSRQKAVGEAEKELIAESLFAWGGIGITQTTSPGERAFRKIIQLPPNEAAAAFSVIYQKASPAGRLYALLGLRESNPERFQRELPTALRSNEAVDTMVGCLTDSSLESTLAEFIAAGAWGTKPRPDAEIRAFLKTQPDSSDMLDMLPESKH